MPTTQEQIQDLAYGISQLDRRLQYTERRVRAVRAQNFVDKFMVGDLGELGDVSTFLDFKEVAVPANPDSGWRRVFANTSTNKLSVRTSAGTTINLEYGDTEAIAAVEGEATLDLTGDVTIVGSGKSLEVINFKFETATELTISSGDIAATQAYHRVDTESDAASDNLDGITGGADGEFLLLRPENDGRTVVVRHNQNAGATKNILLAGGTTATLDDISDMLLLFYDATLDTNGAWIEVARTVPPAATHNILDGGTVHLDTASDGVTEGSIIIGNATPAWDELVISVPAANVRNVLGVDNGETTASWKTALDATNPADVAAAASPGTSLVFAHRDHVHKLGILTTKGDILSYSTVPARLGVGANDTILMADSAQTTGLKWAAPASPSAGIDIGDSAAEGSADTWARSDHEHAYTAPGAGYPLDVAATESDGTATTPARSDHVHAHGQITGTSDLHTEYVLESLFDATTFLYATNDNTPQPKTPAEVLAILSGAATAAFAWNSQNLTGIGTIGCGEITVADGSSINLQEALTFTGATTENLIEFPDNLADALSFKEGANAYLTFITTNGSEKVAFGKDVYVVGNIAITGTVDGVDIAGRDHAKYTDAEAVAAVATDDAYLKNDANDETTGDLTVANLITAGNVDGKDVSTLGTTAEALAAVKAEDPLALTGDVTIAGGKSLSVDTLNEKTGGAGVTVDTVQVIDGALVLIEAADHPIAAAATKGQLWVKNAAPNQLWFTDDAGVDHQLGLGAAHALLDGATHNDSVADAVTRGSLIYGNSTPAWDELVIGAANTVLASDGTDASWTGSPSLSGTLTVDTINEITGGAGVTVENVKALDGFLEFSEIAVPSAPAASKGRLFTPLLTTNDSLTPGTDETGLFYRRNDGLAVKLSDDFPYSQKSRYVNQDDEPTFENSWVNYEAGYRQVHFIKDFLGCIWVTGLVKDGTIGANDIFDLPEGFWNTGGSLRWATISNAAFGILDLVSGSPEATIGNNAYFSLARMAFPETNRITWHEVGSGGGEPAFENSWVNFGGAWDTAGFAKDAIGRVWVKGMVKDGNPTTVFTLPAGYRPSATLTLPIETDANVIGKLTISAAGAVDVTLLGAGTNAWATITCVFQADGAVTWHEVGGGGEPAFENSWVNFGGAADTAAFVKDACGIVHIKGAVKDGGAPPTVVFTLPVGYRPRSTEIASVISNDAIGFMEIYPDGRVFASAGNNAWFTLHFAFVAEQ